MKTLKTVLLINAISSGATGLGLVVLPGLFAGLFATSALMPFVATGLFLIAFAMMVFLEGRRAAVSITWVRFIVIMDTVWVLLSVLIVAFQAFDISLIGYLMIGAVALWVGLMAFLQYTGLKNMALNR